MALIPKSREDMAKVLGIAVAVAEAALAVFMLVDFKVGDAGFQFVSSHPWIPEFGIRWHLGVDGISLFLVLLTAGIFPIAMAGP